MLHIVHIVRPPTDDYTLPSASPRHPKRRKSDASLLGNKTMERRHITAVNRGVEAREAGGSIAPPNAKLGGVSPPKCTCAEIARIAYGGNYRTPNVLKLRTPSRSAPRTLFLRYIHPHFITTGPDARRNCTRVAYGANYRTPNVLKLRPPSRSAPRTLFLRYIHPHSISY